MAVTYGFYDSVNGDRKYNAEQFGSMFDGLITDGVYEHYGSAFSVSPGNGLEVQVGVGRAWFNHRWILNDSAIFLPESGDPLLPPGTLNRKDAVVIRIDTRIEERSNSIVYIRGSESSNPQPPTMASGANGVYEYPLAYITLSPGVSSITNAMIEYKVGSDACPFVSAIASEPMSIQERLAAWEEALTAEIRARIAAIEAVVLDPTELASLVNAAQTAVSTVEQMEQNVGAFLEEGGTYDVDHQALVDRDNEFYEAINGEGGLDSKVNNLISKLGKVPYINDDTIDLNKWRYNIAVAGPKVIQKNNRHKASSPDLGGNAYMILDMKADPNNVYNAQLAFGFGSYRIGLRARANSTWGSWVIVDLNRSTAKV